MLPFLILGGLLIMVPIAIGIGSSHFTRNDMCFIYILYSKPIDKFYIGFTTESVEVRLERHNSGYYDGKKFTKRGQPWTLFLSISCSSERQGKNIEAHIKRMKSKKYINDLKTYPEIISRLYQLYP